MPGGAHVGGVVVAVLGISPERFAEEFEQGLAHGRVDQFGLDGGFSVHQVGRALAVAPVGQGARGHFMQHHGGGEAFGGGVPAPSALLELEERLQVGRGAGADLVERGAGEGEVEQLEAEFVVLAVFRNADVVRLDVAVRYALLLQKLHRFEQVFAETLEQVEREAAFAGEALRQGFDAGALHEETGQALDGERVLLGGDDARVAQRVERGVLCQDAVVVLGAAGNLEHQMAAALVHQQGDGGRTAAEPLFHHRAALQPVAGLGFEWVDSGLLGGAGELLLIGVEPLEEVRHGLRAGDDLSARAFVDEFFEFRRHTIQDAGEHETLAVAKKLVALWQAVSGRLPSEDVIRNGAEREDVHGLAAPARIEQGLRRNIDQLATLREPLRVKRGGPP
jgi:hypothetical protein